MRTRLRAHLTYANVMASIAVFIALGSGAYAATGSSLMSSSGTINGCVPKRGGALRVLQSGRKCPKGDAALPFNARGPAGTAGRAGTNGLSGASGSNGTNGANGSNGSSGGPGPTASASANVTTSVNFISTDSTVPVAQATITTTFTGRILANASLDVQRTSGGGGVDCQLWIGPAGAFSVLTFTRISNPDNTYFTQSGTYEVTIPLTGAAVKPAGTYAIEATCQTGSAATFVFGDIAAVAAAQ
jgi:hypothetical protein